MNSASGHFDDHVMKQMHDKGQIHVDESLVYGGVTISISIGLAHQDTGEQVIREVGLDGIKLTAPVLHGDTLYAYTEVLAKEDVDESSGLITFRHYGVNQDDVLVFQGDRTALMSKSPE
jgi:acyl dehydratase